MGYIFIYINIFPKKLQFAAFGHFFLFYFKITNLNFLKKITHKKVDVLIYLISLESMYMSDCVLNVHEALSYSLYKNGQKLFYT